MSERDRRAAHAKRRAKIERQGGSSGHGGLRCEALTLAQVAEGELAVPRVFDACVFGSHTFATQADLAVVRAAD